MDIVDMYEYYRSQSDDPDSYIDYGDHDDFNSLDNHLDEKYNAYVARTISSDLNKILFYFNEYLNHLDELKEIYNDHYDWGRDYDDHTDGHSDYGYDSHDDSHTNESHDDSHTDDSHYDSHSDWD